MHIINLDANASTPIISEAKFVLILAANLVGNSSSLHTLGRINKYLLDEARASVAYSVGGNEGEVFFTSGASEGNRWFADSILVNQKFKIWVSAFEHPSLARSLQGYTRVQFPELADVVFSTSANSEIGMMTDWNDLIASVNSQTIIISDISQSMGRLNSPPQRIDGLVCSGHKIGGPAGIGAVLIRNRAKILNACWFGGSQERNMRPGTEALQSILAFGAAAAQIENTRNANVALKPSRDYLEEKILSIFLFTEKISFLLKRLPNTSSIVFSGVNDQILRILMDRAGLCVGFGASCASLNSKPSAALILAGLTEKQAKSMVRFSLCVATRRSVVRMVIRRLKGLDFKNLSF